MITAGANYSSLRDSSCENRHFITYKGPIMFLYPSFLVRKSTFTLPNMWTSSFNLVRHVTANLLPISAKANKANLLALLEPI